MRGHIALQSASRETNGKSCSRFAQLWECARVLAPLSHCAISIARSTASPPRIRPVADRMAVLTRASNSGTVGLKMRQSGLRMNPSHCNL